ncbi:MAG: aminoglycoside phosphotransferase family protein [Caldilineaceae bacterium]
MLERPDLSNEAIARGLRDAYGISAQQITFLPIGYDSTASVFRVDGTDGRSFFLKTKSVPVSPPALLVPHFLREIGIGQIVAPLSTRTGHLSAPLGDGFNAILYPFVPGRMGADGGLSPAQWMEFGQIVRRVHTAPVPPDLASQMRTEPFVPLKRELAWALHQEIATASYTDPIQRALADCWRARGAQIEKIFRRAEALGRMAQTRQPEFVLCHADIHIFNVLVTPDEQLYIIDWDETILAPKERDLMFLLAGAQADGAESDPTETAFRQGYGCAPLDPVLLAFYRYEWVVQEIAEFGKQVLWPDGGGEATRLDGLHQFRALFDPGDVVERAYRSDISSQKENS